MRVNLKSPPAGWLLGGFSAFWGEGAAAREVSAQHYAAGVSIAPGEVTTSTRAPAVDDELQFRASGPRRTPRRSLIVVLPENHFVSPDLVSERLANEGDPGQVDVILACAGQPNGIAALQRRVRDLQVLLAPAGTSGEDLRQLAMEQAPGDIVTLVSGNPAQV